MKKTSTIIMMMVACGALIPTLVLADDVLYKGTIESDESIEYMDISPFENIEINQTDAADDQLLLKEETFSQDNETSNPSDRSLESGRKYLKVRGKWGQGKDDDVDGYWGGRITLRTGPNGGRIGIFNGLVNKTANNEKHRIVGMMKKGYFNGKIITKDGSEIKLTGLYKFDRQNHLLKMQWMIPGHAGWAIARVELVER